MKPCLDNLYGLIDEPFREKDEYLERLVNTDDYIEVTTSYSRDPLRTAYYLHSVSGRPLPGRGRQGMYRNRLAFSPAASY